MISGQVARQHAYSLRRARLLLALRRRDGTLPRLSVAMIQVLGLLHDIYVTPWGHSIRQSVSVIGLLVNADSANTSPSMTVTQDFVVRYPAFVFLIGHSLSLMPFPTPAKLRPREMSATLLQ